MNEGQRTSITLETLATILGGAFLINYAILILWFLIMLCAPDWFFGLNAKLFALGRHEVELINYGALAFMKLINLVFFLSPYLVIKLTLRKGGLSR
jgi:hypothetical protein